MAKIPVDQPPKLAVIHGGFVGSEPHEPANTDLLSLVPDRELIIPDTSMFDLLTSEPGMHPLLKDIFTSRASNLRTVLVEGVEKTNYLLSSEVEIMNSSVRGYDADWLPVGKIPVETVDAKADTLLQVFKQMSGIACRGHLSIVTPNATQEHGSSIRSGCSLSSACGACEEHTDNLRAASLGGLHDRVYAELLAESAAVQDLYERDRYDINLSTQYSLGARQKLTGARTPLKTELGKEFEYLRFLYGVELLGTEKNLVDLGYDADMANEVINYMARWAAQRVKQHKGDGVAVRDLVGVAYSYRIEEIVSTAGSWRPTYPFAEMRNNELATSEH